METVALILMCFTFLFCELIPTMLYVFLVLTDFRLRIKVMASGLFTLTEILKYSCTLLYKNQVRNCLKFVDEDWRNVINPSDRISMIDRVRTSKRLIMMCATFVYLTGMAVRIIVPLSIGKIVTSENITIRPLPHVAYLVILDVQRSPVYEIVYFIQFLAGFIKYTISITTFSFMTLCAMHFCGQSDILVTLMNDFVNENQSKNVNRRLAIVVERQIRIRNFLQLVQSTIQYTSLIQIMGSTVLICFVEYYTIMEWENHNVIRMCTYISGLIMLSYNIFIYCYMGEQIIEQGEKVSLTTRTLKWYRLEDATARALILLITISENPLKLKAGNFIDISLRTFGNMFANKYYERDIENAFAMNRFFFRLLGIWPFTHANSFLLELMETNALTLTCFTFLFCELIPTMLYVFMVLTDFRLRVKVMASGLYTLIEIIKYSCTLLYKNEVRNCLKFVEEDWRNVINPNDRVSMIDRVRTSKRLIMMCAIFMYFSGMGFRIIIPLSTGKIITSENITIRPLPHVAYLIIFDVQSSPVYEIVYFIQFLSGLIKYTITVTTFGFMTLCAMHFCAQSDILVTLMNDFVNENQPEDLNKRLAIVVERQIRIRK
ncbi:PREDICTED: uncharacterized protein LOC105148386 [Acromyrmex echinatior]|uniref:uncharacterized protein LOC105148386 n=1 Tax=Acromyrmex echinatior TaxID=103372 RepID=UPI000580D324|nr:PREDICTED: uncharacterized protein LOC105148386 [Acromyrmex echinatior]